MSRASSDAYFCAPLSRMVVWGTTSAAATSVLCALGCAAFRGPMGAWSALGAGLAVTATFALGVLALSFILAGPGAQPGLAMIGAYVVYAGQLAALTAVAFVLRGAPFIDDTGVAVGGIAAVFAWIIGQVRGFQTSRILVFSSVSKAAGA